MSTATTRSNNSSKTKETKRAGNKKGGCGSTSPYHEAADLLNQVLASSSQSLNKSAVYDRKTGQLRVSTKTYAVVSKVLQNKKVLDAVLQNVNKFKAKNEGLLYVLLFELLLSPKQSIVGGGALKRSLLQQEASLRKALKQHCCDTTNTTDVAATAAQPRYVRINTCRVATKEAATLVIQRLQKLLAPSTSAAGVSCCVCADPHVPHLLVVRSWATAAVMREFRHHEIVLQTKSSCFPAMCLLENRIMRDDSNNTNKKNKKKNEASMEEYGDILDACAAPGNKTSHLAALLTGLERNNSTINTTVIYALDRDDKRCQSLDQRIQELVPPPKSSEPTATCKVVVQHRDFLATNPSDYPGVTDILLDPSCSGSGIYGRDGTDNSSSAEKNGADLDRLNKLAGFQCTALRHALSSFESVQRVVYSTCSVHAAENEDVIAAVLQDCRDQWEVFAPACLSTWTRRGQPPQDAAAVNDGDDEALTPRLTLPETQCLIRVNQDDDTNGFFVACLRRKQPTRTPFSSQWRNPYLDLGIPIYNGQFSNTTTESTTVVKAKTATPEKIVIEVNRRSESSERIEIIKTSSSSKRKGNDRDLSKNLDVDTKETNKTSPQKKARRDLATPTVPTGEKNTSKASNKSSSSQPAAKEASEKMLTGRMILPDDKSSSHDVKKKVKTNDASSKTEDAAKKSKKIAKKYEWKRRQREEKIARLKK